MSRIPVLNGQNKKLTTSLVENKSLIDEKSGEKIV